MTKTGLPNCSKEDLERFTENTVRSFDQLRNELNRTRDRGYAFDDESGPRGCAVSQPRS